MVDHQGVDEKEEKCLEYSLLTWRRRVHLEEGSLDGLPQDVTGYATVEPGILGVHIPNSVPVWGALGGSCS